LLAYPSPKQLTQKMLQRRIHRIAVSEEDRRH
jgi:hypothetical protein